MQKGRKKQAKYPFGVMKKKERKKERRRKKKKKVGTRIR